MAYLGPDGYLAVWLPGELKSDALTESCIHLLESAAAQEGETPAGDGGDSRGFIISDWFGPFLLGPPSRFLRGRC